MAVPINPSNEGRRPGYVEPVTHAQDTARSWGKHISWGAVFAGVLVAIVTQMLLTLLGLGIGLATIDPLEEANPASGLGTGAAIWYGVSTLLSLFMGGWVAGRLAAAPRTFDNTLHGVLTWCLTTLLTFYLLTSAIGRIVGGVGSLVGSTVRAVGTGAAAVAPGLADAVQDKAQEQGINLDNLQGEMQEILRQTGKPGLQPEALERQANQAATSAQNTASRAAQNPQAAEQSVQGLINQFFKRGENVAEQVDKEALVNVISARTGKSRQESEQIADNWIRTYNQAQQQWQQTKQQAEQQAREAADKAAAATSRGALFGFLGLTLGLVAAGFGARKGGDSRDDDSALDHPTRETR